MKGRLIDRLGSVAVVLGFVLMAIGLLVATSQWPLGHEFAASIMNGLHLHVHPVLQPFTYALILSTAFMTLAACHFGMHLFHSRRKGIPLGFPSMKPLTWFVLSTLRLGLPFMFLGGFIGWLGRLHFAQPEIHEIAIATAALALIVIAFAAIHGKLSRGLG